MNAIHDSKWGSQVRIPYLFQLIVLIAKSTLWKRKARRVKYWIHGGHWHPHHVKKAENATDDGMEFNLSSDLMERLPTPHVYVCACVWEREKDKNLAPKSFDTSIRWSSGPKHWEGSQSVSRSVGRDGKLNETRDPFKWTCPSFDGICHEIVFVRRTPRSTRPMERRTMMGQAHIWRSRHAPSLASDAPLLGAGGKTKYVFFFAPLIVVVVEVTRHDPETRAFGLWSCARTSREVLIEIGAEI